MSPPSIRWSTIRRTRIKSSPLCAWPLLATLATSLDSGCLRRRGLVEQLNGERAMRDRGSGPQRGCQHGSFGDFLASGAGAFGGASVHIEAVRALRRAGDGYGDKFAILSGDSAVVAADGLVELHEGRELFGRQLFEFTQKFQVVRIVIMHGSSSMLCLPIGCSQRQKVAGRIVRGCS